MDRIIWELQHKINGEPNTKNNTIFSNKYIKEKISLDLTEDEKNTIKHIDDLLIALSIIYSQEKKA